MKKTIICGILLLVISTSSFGQQTDPKQPLTREDYLKKSKNQKTAAWVLLGGGAVLIGTGLLIGAREESSFDDAATGGIMAGIGILSAIGSIPLFIASGKNKRRGMAASAYFKMEDVPAIRGYGVNHIAFPALSVKIKLMGNRQWKGAMK